MVSTWFKGTQINRYHSTSLGPGVKFLLMALSFFMKATRQRSLSEGTFHFRNVQHLQNLWWITTWLNLRGWVITFDFLSVSWEVQKAIFMGMGKISNPGISVLNRIKVREEGAGKKKQKTKQLWRSHGTAQEFLGLLNASNPPCEWNAIFSWKKHGFQQYLHNCSTTVIQDWIYFLTLCRSYGEDLGCVIWDIAPQRGSERSRGGIKHLPEQAEGSCGG